MTLPANYEDLLTALQQDDVYSLDQTAKQRALSTIFKLLHEHHVGHCQAYKRLAKVSSQPDNTLASLPYLSVRLFKEMALKSVPDRDVFRVLQSSGTTGQRPARVFLDKATSARQSKALVSIMQSFIGKQRLPMLIIDCPSVLKSQQFSARAAGIQGMMFFGRKPVYALNDNMSLNLAAIDQFVQEYAGQPVLLFGFTFMVWIYFVQAMQREGKRISLPYGVLIHSGGWKKLIDQQVTNETFKAGLTNTCSIHRVHNFYGMAEQVGSVFVECEAGHLHCPDIAEVITRHPRTLEPSPIGVEGIIQVLSALPTSYPGFSLLTEDLGIVLGIDDCSCQRKGKYFRVQGRIPQSEVRGCSDTFS